MHDMRFRWRGQSAPTPGARMSVLTPEAEHDGVVVLRLYDPIDSWGGEWGVSAKEFAATLAALPSSTSTIELHLNSPGGEVFESVAILNMLRDHPARVVAVVDGIAASAASVLAAGSNEVVMGRNSQLMIHDAWGLTIGNAADMRDMGERLDKLSDNIAEVYAARAPGVDWRAAMVAESWYSADEAVEVGLADRVSGSAAAAQNTFDLSGFRYAGRAQAPDPVIKPVEPAPPANDTIWSDRIERPAGEHLHFEEKPSGSGRWPKATERATRLRQRRPAA